MTTESLVREIDRLAVPLEDAGDLQRLVDRISKAKVVMLGEASHGTHEFCKWRNNISKFLISQHGFRFIALEGDWPPTQQVNKRILATAKHTAATAPVADVLTESFRRWPTWVWANQETETLLEWIRDFNTNVDDKESRPPVRFFGLDVYSLFDSIQVVVDQLEKVDKELAERARKHYACFHAAEKNEEQYMSFLREMPQGCKSSALEVLEDVIRRQMDNATEEQVCDIQQNAKIVSNAEEYYRAVLFGDENSWNVRENHMMDTLAFLFDRWSCGKAIVWAHNTHVGDYRGTGMVNFGEVNLGGLARQKYGLEAVALVGFGSYQGSVIASDRWGGSVQRMTVPPAREGSYEDVFHRAAGEDSNKHFYVIVRQSEEAEGNQTLATVKGHRAIGVVYNPEVEERNYVPTSLSRRYDAFVFFNQTKALEPLAAHPSPSKIPEAWPREL